MGMMDNYDPDSGNNGYAEGVRNLAIEGIETKFSNDGQEFKNFTFVNTADPTKKMYKKIYDDEYAARKITAIVAIVGLDPKELFAACKNGNGDDWMNRKLVGRSGDFDCRKGKPRKDGKQYLEPMTPSEIEYMEWRKAHPKNGQSDGNVQSSHDAERESREASGEFDSDIPF